MPDWQLISVLVLIAGAAGFLALRMGRFFKGRNKTESACGSACHGCQQSAPSKSVVPLEVSKSAHTAK